LRVVMPMARPVTFCQVLKWPDYGISKLVFFTQKIDTLKTQFPKTTGP